MYISKEIKEALFKQSLGDHVVDALKGPIKVQKNIIDDTVNVIFDKANFIIYSADIENIETWIHEFVEQAITRLLFWPVTEISNEISNWTKWFGEIRILCTGEYFYSCKMKHIIAALCTDSFVDKIKMNGDQFAALFNLNAQV